MAKIISMYKGKSGKYKTQFRHLTPQKTLNLLGFLTLALAIPLTVFMSQQQQNTRQQAAGKPVAQDAPRSSKEHPMDTAMINEGIYAKTLPTPLANHPAASWHTPMDHEHGEAPPQWVLQSQWQPFTQTREGHRGYKGFYSRDVTNNQIESYLVTHIITTPGARTHGDHDYSLWIREPNGIVSHWEGIYDFGNPPELISGKSNNRPSIQDTNDNETWYGRLDGLLFIAQVIFAPNQPFNPAVAPGDGTVREGAWRVNANFFPGPDAAYVSPSLKQYCTQATDKTGCFFTFKAIRQDYAVSPMTLPN